MLSYIENERTFLIFIDETLLCVFFKKLGSMSPSCDIPVLLSVSSGVVCHAQI